MTTLRGFLVTACACATATLAGMDTARAQSRGGGLPDAWSVYPAPIPDLPYAAPEMKLFEVEVGGGLTLAPAWEGTRGRAGGNFFAELRLNRPEPWDIGLQFKGANFSHSVGGVSIGTMTVNPALFVDYNLRTWRRAEYFFGVGLGGCFADNDAVVMISPSSGVLISGGDSSFAVTPRVGVKLGNLLRVTAEYVITDSRYSRIGLSAGIVIGGSYRRSRAARRADRIKLWDDIAAPMIIDRLERRRR